MKKILFVFIAMFMFNTHGFAFTDNMFVSWGEGEDSPLLVANTEEFRGSPMIQKSTVPMSGKYLSNLETGITAKQGIERRDGLPPFGTPMVRSNSRFEVGWIAYNN